MRKRRRGMSLIGPWTKGPINWPLKLRTWPLLYLVCLPYRNLTHILLLQKLYRNFLEGPFLMRFTSTVLSFMGHLGGNLVDDLLPVSISVRNNSFCGEQKF